MKTITLFLVFLSFLVSLNGCGPKAYVKGSYDEDVNSTNLLNDRWSETDMQKAVATLVQSATSHYSIANAKRPPIVMVTNLQNNTSEYIKTSSIMDMVRVELSRGGRVAFVDKQARGDIAQEYEYQKDNMSRETKKSKGGQTGADFIINGRLDTIVQEAGRDKTVYYKLTLNMTNLKTAIIVWTDYKQIRKVYKKRRVSL